MQPNDEHGRPTINMSGASAPVIDGTMAEGVCQWMHIGNGPQGGTLNVVAGGVIGQPIWGPGETFMGEGGAAVLNIDGAGSVCRSEGWRISRNAAGQYPGASTVNITNGGEMVLVWWDNYFGNLATVNVISGKMSVLGQAIFQVDGLIDIDGLSTITLEGNRKALMDIYIATGHITGDHTVGNAKSVFDGAYTTVSVPEPVTLALLGLGSLLIRRRLS